MSTSERNSRKPWQWDYWPSAPLRFGEITACAALPLLLYLLRTQPTAQAIVAYPLLSGGTAAFLAFLPINLYNGQRGFIRRKPLQIAFYLFYPAHILLLVLLKQWLMT